MANRPITYTAGTNYDIYDREDRGLMSTPTFFGAWGASAVAGRIGNEASIMSNASKFGYVPGKRGTASIASKAAATGRRANYLRRIGTLGAKAYGDDALRAAFPGNAAGVPQRALIGKLSRTGLGGSRLTKSALQRVTGQSFHHAMAKHVLKATGGSYKQAYRMSGVGALMKGPGFTIPIATKAASKGIQRQILRIGLSKGAMAMGRMLHLSWTVPLAYSAIKTTGTLLGNAGKKVRNLEFGGAFVDTRGSYTERQRALRSITSSRMSARSAIGGEAQLYHR